jgi:hypothetical protein
MFWKAKVDSTEAVDRALKSFVLKAVGDRFVARMTFADGTFGDVEYHRVPRFDLGEIFTISLAEDVTVPTKNTEPLNSK